MINTMQELALYELNHRFNKESDTKMNELRRHHGAEILPLLVEDVEKIQRVYVLVSTDTAYEVRMEVFEVGSEKADPKHLPFVKPSGPNSSAIGPLIKRSYDPKKGCSPKPKTLKTTLKKFQKQAETHSPWQAYFQDIVQILSNAKVLYFNDKAYQIAENHSLLETAVAAIPEKETVFLTVTDTQGQLPGQRQEYWDYLKQELANRKYITDKTPVHENSICPLCEQQEITIYPNAVKGAGINIGNPDRAGAFAGINKENAWKNYGLCIDCADLLYIFKNHILSHFLSRVAGDKALLLLHLLGTQLDRAEFMNDWHKYLAQTQEKGLKKNVEKELMEEFFKNQDDAHLVIQIIWANFGQSMEEVNGYITDILPSRLHYLSQLNAQANKKWQQVLFPRYPMDEAAFDLQLNNVLWYLLKRPGGDKKSRKANESKQFRKLRQEIAAKIYHGEPLDDNGTHLWAEIMTTARFYLADAIKKKETYLGLCYEGYSNKKQVKYWTLAGWIRHIARFIYYLDQTGVLLMKKESMRTYEPKMPKLQALFAEGAGINSDEKAFAFLVGILYGKLLQVQGGKNVNVTSSTVPWLKRLQLSGKDLPELYAKICHKFLVYGSTSQETQEVIKETARVGKIVGDELELDITKTGYFLLLGQALALDVLPKKSETKEENQ